MRLMLTQVRKPLKRRPGGMPTHTRRPGNIPPTLKQPAYAFMPQVMKMQIFNTQELASFSEPGPDGFRIERKDSLVSLRLTLNDGPDLVREIHSPIVSHPVAWVLHVRNDNALGALIQVRPANPCDLILPPSSEQSEQYDLSGWRDASGRCALSVLQKPLQLTKGWPPIALIRLANQPLTPAGFRSIIQGIDRCRNTPGTARRLKHTLQPDQVIRGSLRLDGFEPPHHVGYEILTGHIHGIDGCQVITLQAVHISGLAPAKARTKLFLVPLDEVADGYTSV